MRNRHILAVLLVVLIRPIPELAADVITWKASGRHGAVAAGGVNSVAAGIQILNENGNAADAAVATLLALAVTDYGLFAIGGEVPLIIYDADKQEVKVLCGAGGAPLDGSAIDWFYQNGIPAKGSMKSAPVPGAVDLCVTALRLYGTMSFEQVARPMLALLDAGDEEWHRDLLHTMHKLIASERDTNGSRDEKLQAVRDRFYTGDIADELEAWYIESGALLRKRDLAAHVTRVEDPVSVTYRGYTVYKCGPWTQGPYLCQTLRLLDGFDLKQMGHLSPDYVHVVIESLKLAMADRDEYYGDPRFVDVPLAQLVSDAYQEAPAAPDRHASGFIEATSRAIRTARAPFTSRPSRKTQRQRFLSKTPQHVSLQTGGATWWRRLPVAIWSVISQVLPE